MNALKRLNTLFHITSDIGIGITAPLGPEAITSITGTGSATITGVSSTFYRFANTAGQGSNSSQSGTVTIAGGAASKFYRNTKYIRGADGTQTGGVSLMLCGGGGGSGAQPTGHSHGGGGAGRFVLYDGTYTGTGTCQISVGHGGQNCRSQAGCGHNGGSTTITAQSGISAQAPGGGGGGSAAGQPAGQYGGRPGGSGGAGGCGHNNQGNGSAGGGQAPGADLNNGSGGTGCNQAGGGAGPGSNGYDARPYGYDDQNLNLPGIAPHQGYFCSGGGNTRAPGTGTPGTGNGSYGTNHGGHGVAVVKVGSASGFVDKTFNQSFDTEGNH